MRLQEIIQRLEVLKNKGFILTHRKGPTGVGHTFEQELGMKESNIPIPDIGGRVELKGTRKHANSLITLFTFNRGVWLIKQKDLIIKYGYIDDKGRQALYCTVNNKTPNSQGFIISTDSRRNVIVLKNLKELQNIAEWSTYVIAGKFMAKMDRMILGFADTKEIDREEYFHYKSALLLEKPTPEKFLKAFKQSEMLIDIRMHLKPSGGVRNHGTGFRISEKNLMLLYAKKKRLI